MGARTVTLPRMGVMRGTKSVAVLAVAVAAAAVLSNVREGRACTPPWGGVEARTVTPGDGSASVPRNARLLVHYDTWGGDPGGALTLRAQGGADVAVTITTPRGLGFQRLVAPDAPLAAATTYELLDTLALPCASEDPTTCHGEPAVIATFTTSDGVDTSPPVITQLDITPGAWCVAESCPEGQNEAIESLEITAQDEGGGDGASPGWIHYEYLSTDGEVLAGPTAATSVGRGCSGDGYVPFHRYMGLPESYQVRAVDLAGNVEAAPHAVAGQSCAVVDAACAAALDAGIGGDASGGGGAGGDPDGAGDSGGCAASGGGLAGAALLALGVLLGLRRRRR